MRTKSALFYGAYLFLMFPMTQLIGKIFVGGRLSAIPRCFAPIKVSNSVRTCNHTVATTYTSVIVDFYDSVFALIGRSYRTHLDAGRILTVHAWSRQEESFHVRIFAFFYFKDNVPESPWTNKVFAFAGNSA
jgi:hypothetical protein